MEIFRVYLFAVSSAKEGAYIYPYSVETGMKKKYWFLSKGFHFFDFWKDKVRSNMASNKICRALLKWYRTS